MSDRRTRKLVLDPETPMPMAAGPARGSHETLLWIVVAILATVIAALIYFQSQQSASVPTPPSATAPPTMPRTISVDGLMLAPGEPFVDPTTTNLVARGVVEPVPPLPIFVDARIGGQVMEVYVQPGDWVVPGQTRLVRLGNRAATFEAARRQAAVVAARAKLDAARPTAQHDAVSRAESAHRLAVHNHERLSQALRAASEVSPDVVTPEALKAMEIQLHHAEAEIQTARAALDALNHRLRAEEARALAELQAAEAERDAAEFFLRRLTVIAPPITGREGRTLRVLRVHVQPGQVVEASPAGTDARLVELYDPEWLQVRVEVPARELREGGRLAALGSAPSPRGPAPPPTRPTPERPSRSTPRDTIAPTDSPSASDAPPPSDTSSGSAQTPPVPSDPTSPPSRPDGSSDYQRLTVDPFPMRPGPACQIFLAAERNPYAGTLTHILPVANPERDTVTLYVRFTRPNDKVRPGSPATVEFIE